MSLEGLWGGVRATGTAVMLGGAGQIHRHVVAVLGLQGPAATAAAPAAAAVPPHPLPSLPLPLPLLLIHLLLRSLLLPPAPAVKEVVLRGRGVGAARRAPAGDLQRLFVHPWGHEDGLGLVYTLYIQLAPDIWPIPPIPIMSK